MKYVGTFLIVALALVAMHGCGGEEPSLSDVELTDVMKKDPGGRIQRGSGYDWNCSTWACIDSAFTYFRDGDVVYIQSGTYTWSTMSQYVIDSTLTIIGEDTTAVLKVTAGTSGQTFLTFKVMMTVSQRLRQQRGKMTPRAHGTRCSMSEISPAGTSTGRERQPSVTVRSQGNVFRRRSGPVRRSPSGGREKRASSRPGIRETGLGWPGVYCTGPSLVRMRMVSVSPKPVMT